MRQRLKQSYKVYGAQLLAVCRRYSPDINTAEDMLHDGFIAAFKAADSFRGSTEGELYAWLRRIMVNTCLMRIRKKDLLGEANPIDATFDLAQAPAFDGIPERVLLNMISSLPVGERSVLNLYAFEEMSHKQIADLLGITERASINKLHRARVMLAKKIKEYGE